MSIKLLVVIVAILIPIAAWGQWTEMNVPLEAGWGSEIEAIDYDLDGDLDIMLGGSNSPAGNGYTNLYRNDGNWNFSLVNTGLVGLWRGCSSWADFNNDGFMDVVINGRQNLDNPPFTRLYIGNSAHGFTNIPVNWTGLYYAWVDSGDYNNDGLTDIIMTGVNNDVDYVKLFRNEGNLVFTEVTAGIQNMSAGQCHFVDYDNDGDLDISVMGSNANILYRNDGTDTFTNINANLHPLSLCNSDWGDFDNDGLPDLVTSGEGIETHSYLYKNVGNGQFAQITCPIPGVIAGSLFWGDYDNDGFLDILVTGAFTHYGTKITRIYRNNGDFTFTQQTTPFPQVSSSKAIWADLNNDGKLDVILAGFNGSSYEACVFRNNTATPNTAPSPPTVIFDQNSSTLSFTGALDSTTPSAGLTYNLQIGTTPGGDDVFHVLENAFGYRRKVASGQQVFYFEPNYTQTYYASAQAIDNSFAGSAFGPVLAFSLQGVPMIAFTENDSIDFGEVGIGEYSSSDTLRVMNTGTAVLRLNGISLSNTAAGFEVLTTGFPYQINPGQLFEIIIRFMPPQQGAFSTQLNLFSNAINGQILTAYLAGYGINHPVPLAVSDVDIFLQYPDLRLSWQPVTTDLNGNPLSVDRYVVLFNETTDPEYFWYLGNTTATSFIHEDIALCAPRMMYRIKAIKFYRGYNPERLDNLPKNMKLSWEDMARLAGLEETQK